MPVNPMVDASMVTTALELCATSGSARHRGAFAFNLRNYWCGFADAGGWQHLHLFAALREDAFELMMQHAAQHGANAIICARYDANDIQQGVTEVLAYGTAVTVERVA
jgi:hypothetical protein